MEDGNPPMPTYNSMTDEEHELFINQAAEIDDKFIASSTQPKVEIFVKRFPNKNEELEDIEGSECESEDES